MSTQVDVKQAAEDRGPFIAVPENLPGIAGLFAYKPPTGSKLAAFAHQLLRGPSPLTPGEREAIAALVSSHNDTYFCAHVHAAVTRHLLDGGEESVGVVIDSPESLPVSEKMQALLRIALKVRRSGLDVTPEDIEQARAAGAQDEDIHDAVLVAAAFCMFNRYVDGLGAITPRVDAVYDQIGKHIADHGYRFGREAADS